jgi:hypothetical protein
MQAVAVIEETKALGKDLAIEQALERTALLHQGSFLPQDRAKYGEQAINSALESLHSSSHFFLFNTGNVLPWISGTALSALRIIIERRPLPDVLHWNWQESDPPSLSAELSIAIENSRAILDLENDWDGEGGVGYSETTWLRATDFLRENALRLWQMKGVWPAVPFIEPGPNGSIDLHWRTSKRELLINIPSDPNQPAGYYGDNFASETIKGKLDISENNEWIMVWLMK